jgi:hypothetical protein
LAFIGRAQLHGVKVHFAVAALFALLLHLKHAKNKQKVE